MAGKLNEKKARKVFLDCGANRGQSIIAAKKRWGDDIEVYSFEAVKVLYEKLNEKWLNDNKVKVYHNACWIADEEIKIYIATTFSDASTLYLDKYDREINELLYNKVQGIDMAKFIKDNFSKDDHIILKVDIEGAEYDLLYHLAKENIFEYLNEVLGEWHLERFTKEYREKHLNHKNEYIQKALKDHNLIFEDWHTPPLTKEEEKRVLTLDGDNQMPLSEIEFEDLGDLSGYKIDGNRVIGRKKKILLMSDDLRMHSGIATQSKEFVMGTLKHYDWVQLAGAVKHPDEGKVVDMNVAVRTELGIKDGYLKIYPTSGYGNPDMLRQILEVEKPDAILHFTDPRFWIWFYNMEHEIRQNIPIFYYNIWDDLPDPKYNRDFYRSSDMLMAISKQTYGLNYRILEEYGYKDDWKLKYVPHGVTHKRFSKVHLSNSNFIQFEQKYGLDKYKFKILYLNRNIRRKSPGDVALAYKHMMDKLTPEQRKDCVFVWHAAVSDDNGTDIRAVCQTLLPDYPVIFTHDISGPMNDQEMNFLYNSVDVYINMASNEGFGLGSLESLTVGTPIVVNVTGGMQDQCGFKKDGKYLTADDYIELGSNHRGKYKEHGEWVKPVWPSNISLQGSPMTPYIFDDRCSYEDAGEALLEWYNEGPEKREEYGEIGRQWVLGDDAKMTSEHLSQGFIDGMDTAFENWIPREKYTLEAV